MRTQSHDMTAGSTGVLVRDDGTRLPASTMLEGTRSLVPARPLQASPLRWQWYKCTLRTALAL